MTCGERAVPKESSLGLRFFAHHPGVGCQLHETGPETAEHHAAKTLLAQAGEDTGWKAHVEYVSETRDWIADVLLVRGEKHIALEVQWSPSQIRSSPVEAGDTRRPASSADGSLALRTGRARCLIPTESADPPTRWRRPCQGGSLPSTM